MLTALTLALGVALVAVLPRLRPQEAAMLTHSHSPIPVSGWHPSVPLCERFERVTVLPVPDARRTVRIVEVLLGRREVVFSEATS